MVPMVTTVFFKETFKFAFSQTLNDWPESADSFSVSMAQYITAYYVMASIVLIVFCKERFMLAPC